MAIIADGVDMDEQRQFLEDNGCHDYQGYLFGRSVPDEIFESLVASFHPVQPEVGDAPSASPVHAACVNAGKAFATIASDAVRQIRK